MSFTPAGYRGRADRSAMPPPTGAKCATVTMMLAERMARNNNWSVDDEHFFETNTMNVWQTLEFLSGVNLRKKYHYEGYNDTECAVRTLTPSWRRDSFAEKTANAKSEEASAKYPSERGDGDAKRPTTASEARREGISGLEDYVNAPTSIAGDRGRGRSRRLRDREKKNVRGKKKPGVADLDAEYALSAADLTDLVKCTFNFPRISSVLERLMGTNVVRLTDRKYMNELRARIDEDYRKQLQKRIIARELKEIERERILIIEGKTHVIPPELADDPIFLVDKTAAIEIKRERSKLKTNRERNAERLKLQGEKWERERLQHKEEEALRLEQFKQRRKEQKQLEERYKAEDAERGMDLLRINNEDWRDCEQDLKEFLERERAKMKERSLRVPTAYTSDPLDITNIVRARQKFRETEHKIRKELEEKSKEEKEPKPFRVAGCKAVARVSKILADEAIAGVADGTEVAAADQPPVPGAFDFFMDGDDDLEPKKKSSSDADSFETAFSDGLAEQTSTISEMRRRREAQLEEELENEALDGLLISREQYNHLRYQDERILQLRQVNTIRELYELAEMIIIGEPLEEVAVEEEEEAEEEEIPPPSDEESKEEEKDA